MRLDQSTSFGVVAGNNHEMPRILSHALVLSEVELNELRTGLIVTLAEKGRRALKLQLSPLADELFVRPPEGDLVPRGLLLAAWHPPRIPGGRRKKRSAAAELDAGAVDAHRERDVLAVADDREHDTDDAALRVDRRASGVAGVRGGVRLDELPRHARHDAARHRPGEA